MNTCDTCKWWIGYKSKGGHAGYVNFAGVCESPRVNQDSSAWYKPETDENTVPLDVAGPDSSDNHGLGFFTGPKFGCVHHEPK